MYRVCNFRMNEGIETTNNNNNNILIQKNNNNNNKDLEDVEWSGVEWSGVEWSGWSSQQEFFDVYDNTIRKKSQKKDNKQNKHEEI